MMTQAGESLETSPPLWQPNTPSAPMNTKTTTLICGQMSLSNSAKPMFTLVNTLLYLIINLGIQVNESLPNEYVDKNQDAI